MRLTSISLVIDLLHHFLTSKTYDYLCKGKEVKNGYVYIMASRRNGTLYIGVTSGLKKRVWEHKNDLVPGLTSTSQVHILVYFEAFEDIRSAIIREKQMKKWRREWKIELIEKVNLNWRDLYDELES